MTSSLIAEFQNLHILQNIISAISLPSFNALGGQDQILWKGVFIGLITNSSVVRESKYLVQRFLGRITVVKGILVPNMNFERVI